MTILQPFLMIYSMFHAVAFFTLMVEGELDNLRPLNPILDLQSEILSFAIGWTMCMIAAFGPLVLLFVSSIYFG